MNSYTTEWDLYFLRIAREISTKSKDLSTKVGAVIVNPKNIVVSVGYNGFPRKIEDRLELLQNREEKYKRIIHAETNAILFSYCDLENHFIYTWPFFACSSCSRLIIQAGITKCISPVLPKNLEERWGQDIKLSKQLFTEAGVAFKEVEFE